MTAPWQAARSASRRPLRKYKPVGPVGEYRAVSDGIHSLSERADSTCKRCGYHDCDHTPAERMYGRDYKFPVEQVKLHPYYDSPEFRGESVRVGSLYSGHVEPFCFEEKPFDPKTQLRSEPAYAFTSKGTFALTQKGTFELKAAAVPQTAAGKMQLVGDLMPLIDAPKAVQELVRTGKLSRCVHCNSTSSKLTELGLTGVKRCLDSRACLDRQWGKP